MRHLASSSSKIFPSRSTAGCGRRREPCATTDGTCPSSARSASNIPSATRCSMALRSTGIRCRSKPAAELAFLFEYRECAVSRRAAAAEDRLHPRFRCHPDLQSARCPVSQRAALQAVRQAPRLRSSRSVSRALRGEVRPQGLFPPAAAHRRETHRSKCADLVISANETYRRVAIDRCGKKPDDVVTVYSVPEQAPHAADDAQRRAAQGCADRARLCRRSSAIRTASITSCACCTICVRIAAATTLSAWSSATARRWPPRANWRADLGLTDSITFTGYLRGEELLAAMSTFDIGIIPIRSTSTMTRSA